MAGWMDGDKPMIASGLFNSLILKNKEQQSVSSTCHASGPRLPLDVLGFVCFFQLGHLFLFTHFSKYIFIDPPCLYHFIPHTILLFFCLTSFFCNPLSLSLVFQTVGKSENSTKFHITTGAKTHTLAVGTHSSWLHRTQFFRLPGRAGQFHLLCPFDWLAKRKRQLNIAVGKNKTC